MGGFCFFTAIRIDINISDVSISFLMSTFVSGFDYKMESSAIDKFKFKQQLQVRWMDLDPLAHVNNSIYIQYFELGRGKYISKASPSWDWHKNMFLIANINCDYRHELTLTDSHPQVSVRVSRFGNKSFDLEYLITSEKNGGITIHAEGKSIQVMYDLKAKKSIAVPEWFKDELQAFES